ncbi:putative Suppressor of Mek1 [Paratrimastix pyriformis]|uniref:Suppressor of Mek1 n=1 Tax=Paratrimastix pyriformis TaxID=342808 RepID=A0ABQ8U9P0_9EUKA|nr:putative Suppressor of Mek1 [Paratrimastix pyriformis]
MPRSLQDHGLPALSQQGAHMLQHAELRATLRSRLAFAKDDYTALASRSPTPSLYSNSPTTNRSTNHPLMLLSPRRSITPSLRQPPPTTIRLVVSTSPPLHNLHRSITHQQPHPVSTPPVSTPRSHDPAAPGGEFDIPSANITPRALQNPNRWGRHCNLGEQNYPFSLLFERLFSLSLAPLPLPWEATTLIIIALTEAMPKSLHFGVLQEHPSASRSFLVSVVSFFGLLSVMMLSAHFWQSTRMNTILGGLVCSFLFQFSLIALGNVWQMTNGDKRVSWGSVLICLGVTVICAASIHRVCATTRLEVISIQSPGGGGFYLLGKMKRRAKLYHLNDEGTWIDKGTGWVDIDNFHLVMDSEDEEGKQLLHNPISFAPDYYQREGDTLIIWTDADTQIDMAFSFLTAEGASEIWRRLQNCRQCRLGSVGPGIVEQEMPPATLDGLPALLQHIQSHSAPLAKTPLIAKLVSDNYIPKLLQIFAMCEDVENVEGLTLLFNIFKEFFMLNEMPLLEVLLNDANILGVIGALEYDPTVAGRVEHRKFLTETATFREIIPVNSPHILSLIHQNYRIAYIKDTVLPRVLDEATFGRLNAMLLYNNATILSFLLKDGVFLQELFKRLHGPDHEQFEAQKPELLKLLLELCQLTKGVHPRLAESFFQVLANNNLYETMGLCLIDVNTAIRMSSTEILLTNLAYDATIMRKMLIDQEDAALFSLLATRVVMEPDMGIQAQLVDIVRILVDCDKANEAFLNLFYGNFAGKIFLPITSISLKREALNAGLSRFPLASICCILDLLCFCLTAHGIRVRDFVLKHDLVARALMLLEHSSKHVALGGLRVLRSFIGQGDTMAANHVMQRFHFRPLFALMDRIGSRDNLLNSALMDVFELLMTANMRVLIEHVLENYPPAKLVTGPLASSNVYPVQSPFWPELYQRLRQKAESADSGTVPPNLPLTPTTPPAPSGLPELRARVASALHCRRAWPTIPLFLTCARVQAPLEVASDSVPPSHRFFAFVIHFFRSNTNLASLHPPPLHHAAVAIRAPVVGVEGGPMMDILHDGLGSASDIADLVAMSAGEGSFGPNMEGTGPAPMLNMGGDNVPHPEPVRRLTPKPRQPPQPIHDDDV